MNRLILLLAALLIAGPLLSLVLREETLAPSPARPPEFVAAETPAPPPAPAFRAPGEDSLFRAAAELAWDYVEQQYQPATGLVNSVAGYSYATLWDVGSTLASYYSARELGLIGEEEYRTRMSRALETLQQMRLFRETAFNKNYNVRNGAPAGRNDREPLPSENGYGWSSTDLGRLLVWLRIVAVHHPEFAADAEAVARRLEYDRIVDDEYLQGATLDSRGTLRTYQEGRIGYEQYAAAGFALWGHYADRALDLRYHATQVTAAGVELLTDDRGDARLTSEPFLLMGLELGWWSPAWEQLARRVLEAQEARFRATGQVTMVSEDALPDPPYYFYYYTLSGEGREFAVLPVTTGRVFERPRWVSTKAAFAWYALWPDPYTWRAVQTVVPAATPGVGWSSGIYEGSGRPTGSHNINTAAVILEAALYHALRSPLLLASGTPGEAAATP